MSYSGKRFDTYSTYTAYVRLTNDAKVFQGKDKEGNPREDVLLTYCDNSRFEKTEELWVDARVANWHAERAKKLKKGDAVQLTGKLRFVKRDDGTVRGKIYDAQMATFADFGREADGQTEDPIPPAFE